MVIPKRNLTMMNRKVGVAALLPALSDLQAVSGETACCRLRV